MDVGGTLSDWMGACIGPVGSALATAGWILPRVVCIPLEAAVLILAAAPDPY